MAHAELVAGLLDNALDVLQIFALCRPIGDVHRVCPLKRGLDLKRRLASVLVEA
jgi:hypothetical protein